MERYNKRGAVLHALGGWNKRGQFFILAAVIISAVIISLGITSNQAITNNDPDGFEDFTYEVKKETGAVMDYEIYTNFSGDDDLEDFVRLLAEDIRDRDSEANFLFIYGDDNEGVSIRNYGSENAYVGGATIPGGGTPVLNEVCWGEYCQTISTTVGDSNGVSFLLRGDGGCGEEEEHCENVLDFGDVQWNFWGVDLDVEVSEHRQVVFLIQKNVGDDNYVSTR